ncbi:growth-regulating factor 10-like [Tripterygium wilfordii]|uniref:growth-regulating factor 10-like n=1 Tax=Tripterygium wilfordii TaxID=458696 RepID=UPI0018F85C53|nr:growth-regulating factor 10-like [Tripterygium wilfordii]
MDFHVPPHKIARMANSGIRATNWDLEANGCNRIANSPQTGAALELGRGSDYQTPAGIIPKSCGFTILQWQELKLQSLIYNYIEAGSPVPHHLLVPIWKSVANSLNCPNAALYQQLFGCKNLKKNL